MLGFDSDFGASIFRLWLAAGSAILLILFCVLALFQSQLRLMSSPARRVGFVVVGAIFGAVITWGFLDRPISADRAAERRAFELRSEQLGAQALAPGSPLACLDALAGESVEAACEKSLFASAASVASATLYTAAKLTLLASVSAYSQRGGADVDELLAQLRRSLEADRFGFVAHVLAVRDHCTNEHCKPLALLKDATQVRANLGADKLGRYLEHYAAAWSAGAEVAEATPQPSHKPVNIDFPTAASIPPVNIMNPEPTGPVLPGAAAAAAAGPNPPPAGTGSSQRHTRKQAPSNAATMAAPAPVSSSSGVEPIWPEPVPPPPPSTPTPQAVSGPAPAAPIQLTPSNASAGAAARTQ